MSLSPKDRAERYLTRNPDASAPELAGQLGIAPDAARELVEGESLGAQTEEPPTPKEHYAKLDDLYSELGELRGWHCIGNHDFTGWYRTRDGPGDWDGQGRPWALGKEFPGIRQNLDRIMYATISYAGADWYMDAWDSYKWDRSGDDKPTRVWEGGESPTPEYGDLRAYAPFADIDLADDVKPNRPDGDIPKESVERALELYLTAFADLAGDMSHVYALDSVGGAYAFVAPSATAPLGELFDKPGRKAIYKDMASRLDGWLDDVRENVNEKVPEVSDGTFSPDLLNKKNCLYKAPMSIHSSLDGVVTPIDPTAPSYDFTPIGDVDDDLRAEAEEWAEGFTSDHSSAVASIVETLWPDYHAEAESWQDAAQARVEDIHEKAEKTREQNAQALTADDVPDDIEETKDTDVINAKIEALDVTRVAQRACREYTGGEWDTDPGRNPTRFDPPWRTSKSGTSCYADRDKFVDLQEGGTEDAGGGGALTLAARAGGHIRDSGESVRGDTYWKAVNELRKMGFDIPYFAGKDGTHPDILRLYETPDDPEERAKQNVKKMEML